MTTVLRKPVECFRCKKQVEKADSLLTKIGGEQKYECFGCYKKSRDTFVDWAEREEKVKKEYRCARCNYKFKAPNPVCPYCNKSDMVVKGNISVIDLL